MPVVDSLQDRYAPTSTCFGCGPANPKGLRIKSVPRGDEMVLTFHAAPEHEAFPGYLNGGIAGTLADCHMNWTAAHALMNAGGLDAPPPTVTAEFSVMFARPIPTSGPIELIARVIGVDERRASTEAEIRAGGALCATARGTFVAVKEGHPAFRRW